jgi:hypothetical protein
MESQIFNVLLNSEFLELYFSPNMAVDEVTINFEGKVIFWQYIP